MAQGLSGRPTAQPLTVSSLPHKPMMDRNKAAELPKLQVGFIDFVCTFVYKVSRAGQGLAGFAGKGRGWGWCGAHPPCTRT